MFSLINDFLLHNNENIVQFLYILFRCCLCISYSQDVFRLCANNQVDLLSYQVYSWG